MSDDRVTLCEKISCLAWEHQCEVIKAATALADIYPPNLQTEAKETCLRKNFGFDSCGKKPLKSVFRVDFETGQRVFKKILIVEDDKNLQDSMKLLIISEHPEYTLTFAATGNLAMELIADFDNEFDIVFIDIVLPDTNLNGLDVLRFLKHLRTHIPVCIISAYSKDEYIKTAHDLGAKYLLKPFDPERLLEIIEQA